jgi:hypothetical protein
MSDIAGSISGPHPPLSMVVARRFASAPRSNSEHSEEA